jgi:hypothetical protein
MLDLVLYSGALALAPWALGLAFKLISGLTGPNGPAVPMDVVSPNPDDIDIPPPAARHRRRHGREFHDREWADNERHRPGETRRRVCPRAG